MHAKTFKNNEKEPFSSCVQEAHVRLVKKIEEKSVQPTDLLRGSCRGMIKKHKKRLLSDPISGIRKSFLLCVHERLMRMMENVLFSSFSNFFSFFSTMQTHAQACVRWWKYITVGFNTTETAFDIRKGFVDKKKAVSDLWPTVSPRSPGSGMISCGGWLLSTPMIERLCTCPPQCSLKKE